MVGLNFSSEEEADVFLKAVDVFLKAVENKRKDQQLKRKSSNPQYVHLATLLLFTICI